jgi:hypothetical protein
MLTTGPPSCPDPPVSHVDPRRADPAALHCRAATRRPRARPGRCLADATSPCCSTPRQGPLSLPLRLHATSTPPGRLPAAPLKTERLAAGQSFSSPRAVCLARPCPSAAHASPTAQASASPVFHRRSPSSAPGSVRASPPSAPSSEHPLSCSFPSIDCRLLTPCNTPCL